MSTRPRLLVLPALAALLLAAPAAHAAGAAPAFDARRTLPLGSGVTDPRSLAAGDLDGDGRTDLVAGSAGGGTGTISVLRGTAGGTFAAPLGNPFGLGVAGGAGAVAVGDLNGDARPDVLATIGSGTAADDQLVPLAGDGTGDLQAGTPVTVAGGELAGVALADLDGDGDLDALTASTTATSGDQLGVVEQTPSGLSFAVSTGAPSTQLAIGVAAGDLDGDGAPDALVISRNAGSGSAWVAAGAGITLHAGAPVAVGADPVAVALADVDGDGDRDGLVLDGSAGLLTVLRNDGAGGLTATGVAVPGLTAGSGLAAGDLNGDGAADVVVTDRAAAAAGVLLGDANGGFGTPAWLATGAGPRSPVIADLTGDGVPDLATADASADALSLLPNASLPVPHGALIGAFGTETVGRTGAGHAVTITNTGAAPLAISGIATTGDAADDFLITGDGCTGQVVAAGGAASCTVRLRFAPSAAGARTAALRVRHGDGASYDVALAATGAPEAAAGAPTPGAGTTTAAPAATASGSATTGTTADAAADPAATEPVIPVVIGPRLPATRKPPRLILTLSHRKLEARAGAVVPVGFALGRAAKVVLRVKRGPRTVEIVRASLREGRHSLKWDGRLGRRAAPAGRYRLDVYAVAADGRAARGSVTLTVA
jgi:hypothetical protein